MALLLVASLGFNVFQALFNFGISRATDRIATVLVSLLGIIFGVIYFWLRSWFLRDTNEDLETARELTQNILISLCTKDYKNALDVVLKDYDTTNKEIDRRENITLIVGTILITGSLIILGNTATATNPLIVFPYAFASILLYVLWLLVSHLTTTRLDYMTFTRARAIETALKEHFGYEFGVHRVIRSLDEDNAPLWLEIRRDFWGIILIALSISWLVISLLKP